ncbi:MAG: glyceraldehyde 3-phosphate dehydrogenase NAD-binding domain-containing protein [Candidatus Paceibacterota bacterium]
MATRVAINGVGRIGRAFIRAAFSREELEVVALNDLGDIHTLAYLLKYDSVYGRAPFTVEVSEDAKQLVIDGRPVNFYSEKDPVNLPWGEDKENIDVVVESTGVFRTYEDAKKHQEAGARRVVISAPAKSDPIDTTQGTVLMGINEDALTTCQISSNGSCTTNAGAPVVQILHEAIGIEKAMLNTTHSYTTSQALVDSPNSKDPRRGRAAAENMVPTSTGAAVATTKVIPDLIDKFDGIAVRVPTPAGSIADVTFVASRDTSAEEVNDLLRTAASDERWSKVLLATDEPLVSSDIVGMKYGAIVDLALTRVTGGNLVKVMSWYDNEAGYTHTLVEHVIATGRHI